MALVPCPECQKEVSTEARACPQCAYPFPGKNVSQDGRPVVSLNTCPKCDGPVSQHTQACPQCGVSFAEGLGHQRNDEESIQEMLRCPHCGESYIYTRKVAQTVKENTMSKVTEPSVARGNPLETKGIRDAHVDAFQKDLTRQGSRRRPPLWQAPSVLKEVSSPRYPRSKKNSIIVGVILLVIVAISVVVGAMWQLKGLNPLEALIYWRM